MTRELAELLNKYTDLIANEDWDLLIQEIVARTVPMDVMEELADLMLELDVPEMLVQLTPWITKQEVVISSNYVKYALDHCWDEGWIRFNDRIHEIVFEEGISKICNERKVIVSCDSLKRIELPSSLTYCGRLLRDWDYPNVKIKFNGTQEQFQKIQNCQFPMGYRVQCSNGTWINNK